MRLSMNRSRVIVLAAAGELCMAAAGLIRLGIVTDAVLPGGKVRPGTRRIPAYMS